MIELSTKKTYEFFLKDISETERNGYKRMMLHWTEVESNYTIHELHSIAANGMPGPRLLALMERLQPGSTAIPQKPAQFFRRSMKLFAKVQIEWVESKDDKTRYAFQYETITGQREEKTQITDAMRTKAKFLFRKAGAVDKAVDLAKKESPELVQVIQQMSRDGQLVIEQ